MQNINRRSAVALGLAAAASAAMVKPAASQTTDYKDTTLFPGVVQRAYGENPSRIPGFKTVSMRDIIVQPGSKIPQNTMMDAMVCHITEGELQVVQDDGKAFPAKKNYVWTCNKGTKEQVSNDGTAAAIMRITDLKA